MVTESKNKMAKYFNLSGRKQVELVKYLKGKGHNVSRQKISLYTRGLNNPRRKTVLRSDICQFFGFSDKEIFDRE